MNTEEVIAMIDAITEGKNYNLEIEGCQDSIDDGKIQFASKSFAFILGEGAAILEIDNPRTAREIAGALVAWANTKEKKNVTPDMMVGFMRLMGMSGTPGKYNRDDCWREDWYRRSVPKMSLETIKANMRDLDKVKEDLVKQRGNGHWSVQDVYKAIGICRDELYIRDQG